LSPSGAALRDWHAIEVASEGLRPSVLERDVPDGTLTSLARVEVVRGHPVGLSGDDLVARPE
jgi:hypothetical protein